jgi:flavin-dependent dehydrogenase
MGTEFDAVIVGAGPAGSAAAILLARAGWSVALVEKQRFPRRKVCGECIAASNLPLLEALGIAAAIEADAGPELREVALMRGEREVVAALPAAAHDKHRWGRALGRETLDTRLLEQARAAGAEVFQPWSVHAIRGDTGGWHCEIRSGETGAALTLHAPVTIDAHGSWEALPSGRAAMRRDRSTADLFAFKANFLGTTLREGLLPVLSLDGGYGGMVVAGGGVTTLACCIRSDRLDSLRRAAPGSRAGDVVEAWLRRECRGVRVALQGAARAGPWLAAGPIEPGIRLGAEDGPFLVGNAAGEAHPILGEGMSMALQSAGLLCAHLLGDRPGRPVPDAQAQREIGRRYAHEWRRTFSPRLRLANTFAQMAMRPSAGALLLSLAQRWPGLLTQGARWGGKVRSAVDLATFTVPAPHAASATEPGIEHALVSRAA